MNKNYHFKETRDNERWAIWELDFKQPDKNKLGVFRVYDLYKGNRSFKYAIKFKHRKGQTQEESDDAIITRTIANYYKTRPIYFNRGDRGIEHA